MNRAQRIKIVNTPPWGYQTNGDKLDLFEAGDVLTVCNTQSSAIGEVVPQVAAGLLSGGAYAEVSPTQTRDKVQRWTLDVGEVEVAREELRKLRSDIADSGVSRLSNRAEEYVQEWIERIEAVRARLCGEKVE